MKTEVGEKFICEAYSELENEIKKQLKEKSGNTITTHGMDDKLKTTYRTLDFSSLGIYGNGESDADVSLRRWHQMTMYLHADDSKLLSRNNTPTTDFIIASNLPEKFSYTLESKYEAPLQKLNALSGGSIGNLMSQSMGGSSVIKAGTIMIWSGVSPFKFDVTIPVLDDGWSGGNQNGFSTDFMEALEVLSGFCLPSEDSTINKKDNALTQTVKANTLRAPPNPLSLNIKYGKEEKQKFETNLNGGHITVQLGGMLLVQNCVLTKMAVDYKDTKTLIRHEYGSSTYRNENFLAPLLAELKLSFMVPVATTRNNYVNMLWGKNQGGTTFNSDVSLLTDSIAGGIDKMRGIDKKQ